MHLSHNSVIKHTLATKAAFHSQINVLNELVVVLKPTFPEPSEALVHEDVFVGLHGAVVAPSHPAQVHLGLEADLHHVGGLGQRHRHGAGGAASQDADHNACIWQGEEIGQVNVVRVGLSPDHRLKKGERVLINEDACT